MKNVKMKNLKQKKIQKLIESFKFHCITGHLKLNNVLLLADTSCNFVDFMQALMKMYKQADNTAYGKNYGWLKH